MTNSTAPITIAAGAGGKADMLSGVIPGDRDSLRRITIARMIFGLNWFPTTAGLLGEITLGVNEITSDGFGAVATPIPGLDEVGFYLAYETANILDVDAGPQMFGREWDIRSARALRGADRTLMAKLTNFSATTAIQFTLHWRLLVQYG